MLICIQLNVPNRSNDLVFLARELSTHAYNARIHSMLTCKSLLAVSSVLGLPPCVNRGRESEREGEWWKGRADSDAPLNTDERKPSWILIRLPSLFLLPSSISLHPWDWKYFREVRLSEPRGVMSLGKPFKVKVQDYLICFSSHCRITKQLDYDVRQLF